MAGGLSITLAFESSATGLTLEGLFVSGGRNAEHGMIALRVQDPTARHEEASNNNTVLRLSGRSVSS
jgi:hypothetical protein